VENKIRIAVILAAGMGKRLKKCFKNMPKGFIRFGDKTIIEESIDKLLYFNIEEIIIVTGYLPEFYEDLRKKNNFIKTIKNEKYKNSGSLYSLYCAKDIISSDFLLLESDLIYEPRAIKELLDFPKPNVILLSGYTNTGDEVYVETEADKLVNMSKEKSKLNTISGELVGLSKVSIELFTEMKKFSEKKFKNSLLSDYETDGFVCAAKKNTIFCHKVENLIWCEIDNYQHYINAKNNIYPKIHHKL